LGTGGGSGFGSHGDHPPYLHFMDLLYCFKRYFESAFHHFSIKKKNPGP